MEKIVNRLKRIPNVSAGDLTESDMMTLHVSWLMTQVLFNILKTPLLREKGLFKKEVEIAPKAANVLEVSRDVTNEINNAYVSGVEASDATMDKFYALTGATRPKVASTTVKAVSTTNSKVNEEKDKSSFGCAIMFILFLMSLGHFYLGNKGIGFGLIMVIIIIDWLFG